MQELKDQLTKLLKPRKGGAIIVDTKQINNELMSTIINLTPKCRDKLSERIYWILNDIIDYPNCQQCGKYFKPNFYGFKSNYPGGRFCSSKCSNANEEVKQNTKNTNIERYGSVCPLGNNEIYNKKIETNLRKFGYENPFESPEIQEKIKQTNLERLGYENPAQSPEIQAKIQATCEERYECKYSLQSGEVRAKINYTIKTEDYIKFNLPSIITKRKQTCQERYGTNSASGLDSTLEKRKATCIEKYGYDNSSQSPEIKQKIEITNLERHGVKCVWQSPTIKKKIIQTNNERYNVDYPNQNPIIFAKNNSTIKNKKMTLPSGKEITYQGYENVVILYLLENGYVEKELILGKEHVPTISYFFNEKNRIYFPDIYIPKNNLIIEVKSEWTLNLHYDANLAKRQATIDNGYNFQFWVCSENKILQIIN